MLGVMTPHSVRLLLVAVLVFAAPTLAGRAAGARAGAQDSDLRAERVVDYAAGKPITLGVKVGPVTVHSVEFSDRGRSGSSGFSSMMKTPISETSTVLRAHFLAENATRDEWQVTFTLEFLDHAGKLIDRASKKSSWEGEAKPTDLDHPILHYAVDQIAKVRIRMEARLD